MKKFFKIKYIIILTLLTSCVDEIDMSHFDHKDRIVVNSLFTPDSIFYVQVSKTVSIDKYLYIKNNQFDSSGISIDWYSDLVKVDSPTVELWKNNTFIEKLTPKGRGVFCLVNEMPQANQTYKIKVSAPGFESVYANDIIPEKVNLISGKFNFFDFSPDDYSYDTKVTITFKDPPNQKNYYEIHTLSSNFKGYDEYGNMIHYIFEAPQQLYSDDPVAIAEGETSSLYRRYFFSDKLIDGQTYEFTFYISECSLDRPAQVKDVVLAIELNTISYNYYLYLKKLREYKRNKNSENLEDFYKSGDPIIMYSNVENGYGVFAGYSSDTIVLTDKDQMK